MTAWKLSDKQKLVGAVTGYADDRITFVTENGIARQFKFDAAPRRGRSARGGAVLQLKDKDAVARIVPVVARVGEIEPEVKENVDKSKGVKGKGASGKKRPATKVKK